MNTTVNEAYIKRKLAEAGRRQVIGLGMLAVSLVISLLTSTQASSAAAAYWPIFVAYPLLIIGFPFWQSARGRSYYWKTASKLAPVVTAEVQPGPKNRLYAYLPIGDTVMDYLLVGPEGLFVIELKGITDDAKGGSTITCRQKNGKDQWSQSLGVLARLVRLGEAPLGNPSLALDEKITALKTWMQAQGLPEVAVWGVVVFRQGTTPLNIEDATYEVMHLNEFRNFLNYGQYYDQDMRPVLHGEARNRISAALNGLLGVAAAAPQPKAAATALPARKPSAAAVAERERVREIRAARAAGTAAPPARKPGPSAAQRPAAPPQRPPSKNGKG
ncbi:MAG: nuclease-related domain-containing protein [Chloroflexia bacterium]